MQTIHTEPTQINDFNRIAQKYGFQTLDIADDVREQHSETLNTEHEIPQQVSVDSKILSGLLRPTFDIVAPNWQISDDEINMLVEVYTPVMDKYNMGRWLQSVELNAVLVTMAIFYSRKGKPRKIPQQVNQPQEQQQNQQVQNDEIIGVKA
jgi:hypothetical protein